jgi:hypothetical protein
METINACLFHIFHTQGFISPPKIYMSTFYIVTLLEVVKMNCARARIGNLCNIFSEKKLITEHTCDYCRLAITKIL